MRNAFLRANDWQNLFVSVERNAKTLLHPRGDRLPKRWQAELERITAHERVLHCFRECGDRARWRRHVCITGTEIDDIHAFRAQLALDFRHVRKRIRRKARKAIRSWD